MGSGLDAPTRTSASAGLGPKYGDTTARLRTRERVTAERANEISCTAERDGVGWGGAAGNDAPGRQPGRQAS